MDCSEMKNGYCEGGRCRTGPICGDGECDIGLGECDWCRGDCAPVQCFDELCGNGFCDSWTGETADNCFKDCGTPEPCNIEGSPCSLLPGYGTGLRGCCEDLECIPLAPGATTGKCVDPLDPAPCQEVGWSCALGMGACCEDLVCHEDICKEPDDVTLIERIQWYHILAVSFGVAIVVMILLIKFKAFRFLFHPWTALIFLAILTVALYVIFSLPMSLIAGVIFG